MKPAKSLKDKIYLLLDKETGRIQIKPKGLIHKCYLDDYREDDSTSVVGPISKEDLWDLIEGQEPEYSDDSMTNKEKVVDSVEWTLRLALGVVGLARQVTIHTLVYRVRKQFPEIDLKESSIRAYVYDTLGDFMADGRVMKQDDGTYVPTDKL